MKKITLLIIIIIFLSGCNKNTNYSEKDNYYKAINNNKLSKIKLKDDEYAKSTFTIAQDKVDKEVNTMIKEIIKKNKQKDITIIYNQLLDTTKNNKNNISSLKPYIDKIDNSKNLSEFINNAIYVENNLNIDIFTNIKISSDLKDTNKNIIYFYPITYDFNTSSDYYINKDYMAYKALIKGFGIKILKEYGYSPNKARQVSEQITNMYINISKNSKTSNKLEDIENYYNIITKDDLQKIYQNINIKKYLSEKNIPLNTKFSIVDTGNYQALNSYLKEENLILLKEYVKLKILENYAIYINNNYSNIIYELNSKLSGTKYNKTNEQKCIDNTKTIFAKTLDNLYQEKYLTSKKYNYLNNMTKDIINIYKEDLKEITWLNKETRKKAIKKLEKLAVNIGSKKNNDYIYNLENNDSLINNIIKIGKINQEENINILKKHTKITELSETTVNAYYNPNNNSINFPTASLKLFNEHNSYYQNLGSIGMIIAHEITHAFDLNGSKFDEYGNINNWWTKKDSNNYSKLKEKVITYYNKYEVHKGIYINGKKTVNENIADLGAISTITNLAKSKKATINNYKTMYESFAKLWMMKTTPQYQDLLLLEDNHSNAQYRVNAPLSSTDMFYKVYNINFYNKMYIPKKERVKIW